MNVSEIVITGHQRTLRRSKVAMLAKKMAEAGYNQSYPVTITVDNELVDGGHRIAAAKEAGIQDIPVIVLGSEVSAIAHSIRCNADGTDTSAYDVFDYAELCWTLTEDGISRDDVAKMIGWKAETAVSNHRAIIEKLSQSAYNAGRVTADRGFVIAPDGDVVTQKVTNVTFAESHFRAFLKELPYDREAPRRADMRAQVAAIRDLLGLQKQFTAKDCTTIAAKHAWRSELKCIAISTLSSSAPHSWKREIFGAIGRGTYGDKRSDDGLERIARAIKAYNDRILKISLYEGLAEDMGFIADGTVDLIVTSPPYNLGNIAKKSATSASSAVVAVNYDDHSDDMPQEEYERWQIKCLIEMYRVAKEGASLFYNHRNRLEKARTISPFRWLLSPDNPWQIRQEIVWNRKSGPFAVDGFFNVYDERIYWLTKGAPKMWSAKINQSTIWECHGWSTKDETTHPAAFTPELPRMIMKELAIPPGSVILDPFAGSCTTIKVATEFKCEGIGVDKSVRYLEEACLLNKWSPEYVVKKGKKI